MNADVTEKGGDGVDAAALAQETTGQFGKDHSSMEDIERLRASKARFETEQFQKGKAAGREWAKVEAEYCELRELATFDLDDSDYEIERGTIERLIDPNDETDPGDWFRFWEAHYGRGGNPTECFLRGFIEGATEVYDTVADKT
jgi:hypothetical protein